MKSIRSFLIGMVTAGSLAASLHFLKAQETATSAVSQDVNSMSDTEVLLQTIESVPPAPATSAPRTGTFWSAQHAPGTRLPWPPLPCNGLQLPVWNLGDGIYLVDDRNVDYAALQAAAELAMASSPGMNMTMMSSSLSTAYAYGNPVYLTNLAVVSSNNGSMIASFNIAGGTNFVPYDILMSTNMTTSFSQWNWLGIGYTSNRYTFSGQPAGNAFYMLAKPSKTMTVGWGQDAYTQSDVPSGLTNAVMVAGGYEQGLALLADGTIETIGYDFYNFPTNLTGVAMVACGWNHDLALLTNGTVRIWGYSNTYDSFEFNMPANITNAVVVSAQAFNSLVLCSNGTVIAWGDNAYGQTNIPPDLTNAIAIACGDQHNLAVRADGRVVSWGSQTYVPPDLSNVVDVAAGWAHSVALKSDGTVVAWGNNTDGQTNVPAGLTNAVAIAAGGFPGASGNGYTMVLKKDGTVVTFGKNQVATPLQGLNHVIAIGGGFDCGYAIRSGPPTPVITLEPVDQYQIAGGNVTFNAKGAGLYGVAYQWQSNSVDIAGATNTTLALTNVQASGSFNVVVADNGGIGSIVSSNATFTLVTPPVITWQSDPTNIVCIYGNYVSFAATASAPGQANGFPLHYQWRFNGTNIPNANTTSYSFFANDNSSGIYSLIVTNLAGSASASWWVTVTNAINVTNDLLLIYNTNSADSKTVLNYYLAHRPMASGANVLGIGCTNSEIAGSVTFSNQILAPYLSWLTNNPSKHPQYVVLFLDIPSRVEDTNATYPSVQYQIYAKTPGGQPFVTSINMGGTNDCVAYINKLASFGVSNSPGQVVISASASGYGNTNFVVDNIRNGGPTNQYEDYSSHGSIVSSATNGLIANGVSSNAIFYYDGLVISNNLSSAPPHATGLTNVAGYISWGVHGSLASTYPVDETVAWKGHSSWWLIRTEESYNGQRAEGQGTFLKWFSSTAFGGVNYSNTPVGGVTYVKEPGAEATDNAAYFGQWASGKNFAICAWNSIIYTGFTPAFQMVGDPFVTR